MTLQRFPGLHIKRKIPCPGHDGQPCLGEFNYNQLEKAMQKNVPEIQCQEALKMVSVPQLLFGLCLLLKELDSSDQWGGLKAVHVKPQDDVLWLCEEHVKEHKPD